MSFSKIASRASVWLGSSLAFICAVVLVLGWAITGPIFHYSDAWSLFINTVTTVITFVMIFIVQNTQNRDMLAIHLKLDELLRATDKARNALISIEEAAEKEIKETQRLIREEN